VDQHPEPEREDLATIQDGNVTRSTLESGYNFSMRRLPPTLWCLTAALFWTTLLLPAGGVLAWSPASQHAIALEAARLAPPDLYRQLRRNRASYLIGVDEPATKGDPSLHRKHPDGSGQLDRAIHSAVNDAILSIRLHRPFNEISYRLGLVAHYLADANNPLNTTDADSEERRYYADFLNYLESTRPRVRTVFYGFYPRHEEAHLDRLLATSLSRSRRLYPLVGREYRRVGFASGRRAFDDRSTAFAIASLARSHAVSDIAETLRYIWISAGGIDSRGNLPLRGTRAIRLP
jgi:hypothetical protein